MNYTQLVAAIGDLLHRSDLSSAIPNFIMLAEARLNRDLRVRHMEIVLPATAVANNVLTLPAGVVDVKSLWVPGKESAPLDPSSYDAVLAGGLSGVPTMYCRTGADGVFVNGGGDLQGIVYERIPALGDSNLSNWLIADHPDVYLYGSLIQAAIYTKDDATAYEAQYTSTLNDVTGVSKRITGRMRIRAR